MGMPTGGHGPMAMSWTILRDDLGIADVEQRATVGAEDVLAEEGVDPGDEDVFADDRGAGVLVGDVALLRGAHVVGAVVAGPAEYAPPARRRPTGYRGLP